MFNSKKNKIIYRLNRNNNKLQDEINELKKEKQEYLEKIRLLEKDFIKQYHIAILQKDLSSHGIKVYQDGNEIKNVHSLQYGADINNLPNITLEVH